MADESSAAPVDVPVAAPAAPTAPVAEEIGAFRRVTPGSRARPPHPSAPPPLPPPDTMEALRRVISKSLVVDGVRRGLHEAVKALARATKQDGAVPVGGARLAILAADCDEASYVTVVKALAAEKGVPLIEVPLAASLGEWCGLCKVDREGKPRKIVSTSCAVITCVRAARARARVA